MKIECLREKLISAVSKVEKVTGKNISLPVLACILLEAKNGNLSLRATNLDLGIEISIPAKVEEEGIVAVSGSVLNNFISNLQNEKVVKMATDGGNLKVSSESSRATLKTLPAEDFPTIPQIDEGDSFKIATNEFLRGLRGVSYSAAVSGIKPELSSVYLYSNDKDLVFVATDSFRLAEKKIHLKKELENISLLIPSKNVSDILRIVEDSKDDLEVNYNKNQISLSFDSIYIVSRVIDGVFPDYRQIIPKEHKTEVVVLKQDLVSFLKISNIFSDSFNQVNIKIQPKESIFELKTKNSNVGENVNSIQASLIGEDIDVNFNYKYIVDCFSSVESDSIVLQFNGMNRPLLISGVSDKSFVYIVMPMNK